MIKGIQIILIITLLAQIIACSHYILQCILTQCIIIRILDRISVLSSIDEADRAMYLFQHPEMIDHVLDIDWSKAELKDFNLQSAIISFLNGYVSIPMEKIDALRARLTERFYFSLYHCSTPTHVGRGREP